MFAFDHDVGIAVFFPKIYETIVSPAKGIALCLSEVTRQVV